MKNTVYEFSVDKNQDLINEPNISFEEIVAALGTKQVLDIRLRRARTDCAE